MNDRRPETPEEFMRRYPRITAHIIAESLGYATPTRAAWIGLDGLRAAIDGQFTHRFFLPFFPFP